MGLRMMKPKATAPQSFEVKTGDLTLDVTESGTVEAVRWVDVRPRTGGRLVSLTVEEGAMVQPGQVLARIDPMESELTYKSFQAQVASAQSRRQQAQYQYVQDEASARADLKQSQSRLNQLKSELDVQPSLTRSSIESATATLEGAREDLNILKTSTLPQENIDSASRIRQAKAAANEALNNFNRAKDLSKKGFIAVREFDAAQARYETTMSELDAATQAKGILERQQPARVRASEQRVHEAEAAMKTALSNGIRDKTKRDEYESAVAQLSSSKARLQGIRASKESVRQAEAGVDQISSQAADAARRLRETEIRAPMRGMATKRYLQIGDTVTAQSDFSQGTAVYQIADLTELKIKLLVNEIDVAKLRKGQIVRVTVDAVPGKVFDGRVHQIGASSQGQGGGGSQTGATTEAVVKFEVEVRLMDPDMRLKPGMSAKCRIVTAYAKSVPLLAAEAVGKKTDKNELETYYGLKLTGKQKKNDVGILAPETIEVPLTVGLKSATQYEIVSGARAGDKFARAPFAGPKRRNMGFGPDNN